jgi:flagellar protein FliO/FliZ
MTVGVGLQSLAAVLVVLGLLGALAFAARRGTLSSLKRRGPVAIETAVPLGERRSLVVVSVEGRRLLIGMTPGQVSLVTELQPEASRTPAPGEPLVHAFDREVAARL